ncbi:hypothetical protein DIPPA_25351 [Diplonema papillatum]|nr:hypothetical protein DIPPA_25351 [Diplonema papillatum]
MVCRAETRLLNRTTTVSSTAAVRDATACFESPNASADEASSWLPHSTRPDAGAATTRDRFSGCVEAAATAWDAGGAGAAAASWPFGGGGDGFRVD